MKKYGGKLKKVGTLLEIILGHLASQYHRDVTWDHLKSLLDYTNIFTHQGHIKDDLQMINHTCNISQYGTVAAVSQMQKEIQIPQIETQLSWNTV